MKIKSFFHIQVAPRKNEKSSSKLNLFPVDSWVNFARKEVITLHLEPVAVRVVVPAVAVAAADIMLHGTAYLLERNEKRFLGI